MSDRFIRAGDSIQHTPAAAVGNGAVVVVGVLVGVAQEAIAAQATGTVAVAGCWRLPKMAGAIAAGAMLNLNTDAGADHHKVTAAAADAGDIENCAVALAAAGAADDDVEALLLPGRGAVKA